MKIVFTDIGLNARCPQRTAMEWSLHLPYEGYPCLGENRALWKREENGEGCGVELVQLLLCPHTSILTSCWSSLLLSMEFLFIFCTFLSMSLNDINVFSKPNISIPSPFLMLNKPYSDIHILSLIDIYDPALCQTWSLSQLIRWKELDGILDLYQTQFFQL